MDRRLSLLRSSLQTCSLIIYSGDVLTMDSCHGPCNPYAALARQIVDRVGRPFMFTLGNHDGDPVSRERWSLRQSLNASALHIGSCDASLDACVHATLGIATLYSGKTGCHSDTYYGCPAPSSASWIDTMLAHRAEAFALLVTHIPPPNVLGLSVAGVVGEHVCCWDRWRGHEFVLPSRRPRFHAFGHDHSNLFVSDREAGTGVRYLATFKSGWAPPSYDANFYRGSQGFTVLNVSEEGATFVQSQTLAGESMSRFYSRRSDALLSQARCCPNTGPLWRLPQPPSIPPMPTLPTEQLGQQSGVERSMFDQLNSTTARLGVSLTGTSLGLPGYALLALASVAALAAIIRARSRACLDHSRPSKLIELSPFASHGLGASSTTCMDRDDHNHDQDSPRLGRRTQDGECAPESRLR
jgi:hypothetical protein